MRVILLVVASALGLYVLYLLRTPLTYLVLALFLAVAAAGPVNALSRRMSKGLAIAIVYVGIVLIPLLVGVTLVRPAVEGSVNLVNDLPSYVQETEDAIDENSTLQDLDERFDITGKLDQLADDAVASIDDAAAELASIGAGVIGLLFAYVTILVMSIFMVSRGPKWIDAALSFRPPHEAAAVRRALESMAYAVGSYIGGALAQAAIAGAAAFLILVILGVSSPLPLAILIALFDLIPLVGATIGAVIVGVVTLFTGFPTVTIIWAIFAIAYQQFENYIVQPRIQSRATELDPFVVIIAALFGGTLFGVFGALLAIPVAASIQIAIREFISFRRANPPEPAPVTA